MAQDLDVIDTTVQKTYLWIKQIMEESGWYDRQRAYLALRAVLHTLRDRLTVDEAADLSAQLPMLIRGIYFEGWRPAGKPERIRRRDEFIEAVRARYPGDDIDPVEMTRAVFRVLSRNITGGEMREVLDMLPEDVRSLAA